MAAEAHGFVLGEPTDDVDRFAAVLQGVGFVERLCFDYLDSLGAPVDGALSLTGGATRSSWWCQLRADILNRPVVLPENAEPALGMAVLAASTASDIATTAARMVRIRDTIDPRASHVGRFDEAYTELVDELESRGWLQSAAAAHARKRTSQ